MMRIRNHVSSTAFERPHVRPDSGHHLLICAVGQQILSINASIEHHVTPEIPGYGFHIHSAGGRLEYKQAVNPDVNQVRQHGTDRSA